MNYTIRIAQEYEYEWLTSRARIERHQIEFALAGVDQTGTIKGMVGLYSVTPTITQTHIAFDEPIVVRHLVGPAFRIGFGPTRLYVLAAIPGDNEKSLRFAKHTGFHETYRLKDGWNFGTDMVMLVMDRSECRWLSKAERMVA